MMPTLIATVVVFALALTGMAIGVIVSNRRLKGSCGGLAGMQDDQGHTICDACTTPSDECRGLTETSASEASASEASGNPANEQIPTT